MEQQIVSPGRLTEDNYEGKLERGREVLAAHMRASNADFANRDNVNHDATDELLPQQPQQRTEEERQRLLNKGRALLAARLSDKHHDAANTTGHNNVGEDGVSREQQQQLDMATVQHAADAELIASLQAEIVLARKQLDAARREEYLHTPLKLPPSSNVVALSDNFVLQSQLQEQLVHITGVAEQRADEVRVLQEKQKDLEAEALALCSTIAELQHHIRSRDDQLAKALAEIDQLESSGAQQSSARRAAAGEGNVDFLASPSATVNADQMLLHTLEEQVHQLSREKLELERETDGQREIITNLQTQWNSLVAEVQKRETILTDQVRSLQQQLATSTSAAAAAEQPHDDFVHKSKLEELRTSLYAEFNQHVANYQEVNNKYWTEMNHSHRQEVETRDATIAELQKEIANLNLIRNNTNNDDPNVSQAGVTVTSPPPSRTADPSLSLGTPSELAALQNALEESRKRLEEAQGALEDERRLFAEARNDHGAVVKQLQAELLELDAKYQENQKVLCSVPLQTDPTAVAVVASPGEQEEQEKLTSTTRSELAVVREELASTQHQLAAAASMVEQLRDELHDLRRASEAAETQTHDLTSKNDALSLQLRDQAASLSAIEQERDDAIDELRRTQDIPVVVTHINNGDDEAGRREEEYRMAIEQLQRNTEVLLEQQKCDSMEREHVLREELNRTRDVDLPAAVRREREHAANQVAAAVHETKAEMDEAHREACKRQQQEAARERVHQALCVFDVQEELGRTVTELLQARTLLELVATSSVHERQIACRMTTSAAHEWHDKIVSLQAHHQTAEDQLINEVQLCKSHLSTAHAELNLLKQQIAALQSERRNASSPPGAAAAADDDAKQASPCMNASNALRDAQEEMTRAIEASNQRHEEARASLAAAHQHQVSKLSERIKELERIVEQSANRASQQQLFQHHADENNSREIFNLQQRLIDVTCQLEATRAAMVPLEDEVKNYISVVAQLEGQLASRSRELGCIREEMARRLEQIAQLEDDAKQSKTQLEETRRDRASQIAHIQTAHQQADDARRSAVEAVDHTRRELERAVAAHGREMVELRASYDKLEASLREDLQQTKAALATANALLQAPPSSSPPVVDPAASSAALQTTTTTHNTSSSTRVSEDHVQWLQSQLADQTRQCQRLATQLQLAQDEIVEKSSIIRDQDISLTSLGEHHETHQTLQQCADRVEELEARLKRVTRERDGALMEKDMGAVELTNVQRKLEGKDQTVKRLEAEIRAQKQQLQTHKSDNAAKLRQLSDLRQEVVLLQSRLGAAQERLEDETAQRQGTEWCLHVLECSTDLYEAKVMDAWSLLTEGLLVNGYAAPFADAVQAFSDRNSKLLRRCDDIDTLAQEALADGLRQNRELRDQCRAQQQSLKLLEDAYAEGERRQDEMQQAYDKASSEIKTLSEEAQNVRVAAAAEEASLRRDLVAVRSQLSQAQSKHQRLVAEYESACEVHKQERERLEETATTLKATLKSRTEQLHALEKDSTRLVESTSEELLDARRELGEVQRVLKITKAQVDEMKPRLEIAEPAVSALEGQVAELTSSFTKVVRQREQEGNSFRRSIEVLEEQLREQSTTFQEAQREVDGLTQERVKLMASLHVATDDAARLRERLSAAEASLAETTTTLDEEREAWYREKRAAEQRHATLQVSARAATTERDDAVGELQRLRASLEELEKDKKATEGEQRITLADLNELQQAHKRKIFEAEHTTSHLKAELADVSAELQRSRVLAEQLKNDKAALRHQSETNEQLLRDANALNVTAHREVSALQAQLSDATDRLGREIAQLRSDLATAKKVAAASEVRARDAERTCEALTAEKNHVQEEAERNRMALLSDLQSTQHDKQESHARAAELHRQNVALESELDHFRRQLVDAQGQTMAVQKELAEYRSLVHATSERARGAVTDREELHGQIEALRDELRRQKAQLERRAKDAEDALQDRNAELEQLQTRIQQGSHVLRSSEMSLQQHITDLTVAQHQLKHEMATLTANNEALNTSLDNERSQTKKAIAESAAARQRLSELEEEHSTKRRSLEASLAKQQEVVAQLMEELEGARVHATEDKKTALASLERVIQADRQALADVRQARERALRACDQAQREKADLEGDIEQLTTNVRAARLETEAVRQELQSVIAIAEQAAAELGAFEDTSALHSSRQGFDTRSSFVSPDRDGSGARKGGTTSAQRSSNGSVVGWFSSLMDTLLRHLASVRGGANAVAVEKQQVKETSQELEVHERAIQDAAAALQETQLLLRRLSDRVEVGRASQQQQQGYRSGSRSVAGSDDGLFTSRDSSHERGGNIVSTPRTTTTAHEKLPGAAANSNGVQHTRLQRFGLSRLVQQSLLLEKCLQTASVTQDAMRQHVHTAAEQVEMLERAAMTCVSSTRQQASDNHRTSAAAAVRGGARGAIVSASSALEMFASDATHVMDSIRCQSVVLGAGLCVIATRVAQQTRMLVSLQQQLTDFQSAAMNTQISLDSLLLSGTHPQQHSTAPPGSSSSSSPPFPLVHNPREFALVFSQGESLATLGFLALAAMSPVTMTTSLYDDGPAAPASASGRGAAAAHSRSERRLATTDESDVDIENDGISGPSCGNGGVAEDGTAGSTSEDDDDGADAKIRKTRAFQKLRKENKRLYVLVRNLTEKLKVASTQAVSGSGAAAGGGSVSGGGRPAGGGGGAGRRVGAPLSRSDPMHDVGVPFVSPIRSSSGAPQRGQGPDEGSDSTGEDDDDDEEEERAVVHRQLLETERCGSDNSSSSMVEEDGGAHTVVGMSPEVPLQTHGGLSPEADVRWIPRP